MKSPRSKRRKTKPLRGRIVDPVYLNWIRSRPCLVCGGQAEAHHIRAKIRPGMALRSSDCWAVPLCHGHHMTLHETGELDFWISHGIDAHGWAKDAWAEWGKLEIKTNPT